MNRILKCFAVILLALKVLFFFFCNKNSADNDFGLETPIFPNIDKYPSWSPDGTRIIYDHMHITNINYTGSYDLNIDSTGLWIVNADGSCPRMLLKGFNIIANWSPEGDEIVFSTGGQIYKASITDNFIDVTKIVQLTNNGKNHFPSFSSDGKQITYDSDIDDTKYDIWIMDTDGSNKTNISFESDVPEAGGWRMPYWSPCNDYIVHIRYSTEHPNNKEIYVMNSSGKNSKRLTYNNCDDRYPKYSFNGTQIVFASQSENSIPQVWTMNSDGSNLKCLTSDGGMTPAWSPDGRIVYLRYNYYKFFQDNGTLWIMNPDGSNKKQLTFNHAKLTQQEKLEN